MNILNPSDQHTFHTFLPIRLIECIVVLAYDILKFQVFVTFKHHTIFTPELDLGSNFNNVTIPTIGLYSKV